MKTKAKLSRYKHDSPLGLQEFEAPRFPDNRHLKVARLSGQGTHCFYRTPLPPGDITGSHFYYRPEILSQLKISWTPYEIGPKTSPSIVVPQPTASVFTESV